MSSFKEVDTGIDGMRGWKREVEFGVAVAVVCRCFCDYLEPVVEWETLVTTKGDWYVFDGDFREQLAGLTAEQLREWCDDRVAEKGRQEEAS